jgi:hypothetical protein
MESSNPKDVAASTRAPLHLVPAIGAIHASLACRDGALKYGPYNWRDKPIELMSYLGALERHIARIKDGEDIDEKSGASHLGHIIATCSILLDAQHCATLIDDRPKVPGWSTDHLDEIEGRLGLEVLQAAGQEDDLDAAIREGDTLTDSEADAMTVVNEIAEALPQWVEDLAAAQLAAGDLPELGAMDVIDIARDLKAGETLPYVAAKFAVPLARVIELDAKIAALEAGEGPTYGIGAATREADEVDLFNKDTSEKKWFAENRGYCGGPGGRP